MKASSFRCVLVAVLLCACACLGQSTVHFANTGTTTLSTNDFVNPPGLLTPVGAYRIGLYLGPSPSTPESLAIVANTLNSGVPGRFDGGNAALMFPVGSQVTFQVRAWSAFAGATYEDALVFANSNPGVFAGRSTVGSFIVPGSGMVEIFGTGPGQVGGFILTPVPEPAAGIIAAVGAAFMLLWRRCIRS